MNSVKLQDTRCTESVAFLYTNNKLAKWENMKATPVTITSRRIKNLGISWTKEVKDLYSKHYKTPMKEAIDDTSYEKITF